MPNTESKQAELKACISFLNGKIGSEAAQNLLKVSEDMVINTAKSLQQQFSEAALCSQLDKLKIEEKELSSKGKELIESLQVDLEPAVNAMLETGTGSVSKSITLPFDSLKAINLGYESDEMAAKARKDQGIPAKLKQFAEGHWNTLTKLAVVKKGTKDSAGFTLSRINPATFTENSKSGVAYMLYVNADTKAE